MNVNEFLAGQFDVSSAKHGDQVVYVGRDQAMQWSVFWNGQISSIPANTSEEAEAAAHQLIDGDNICQAQLDWQQVPETKSQDPAVPAKPRG
jgi:hypothetical protein